MAIARQNEQTFTSDVNGTSHTFSYDSGSTGSNRVLVLRVNAMRTTQATWTVTATYNGVSMTEVVTQDNQSTNRWYRSTIFRLVAPDTGTHNIVITHSLTAASIVVRAEVLTGVDTTTPTGDTNSATSTVAAVTADVSGVVDGSWVLAGVVTVNAASPITYTWSGDVTEDYDTYPGTASTSECVGSGATYVVTGSDATEDDPWSVMGLKTYQRGDIAESWRWLSPFGLERLRVWTRQENSEDDRSLFFKFYVERYGLRYSIGNSTPTTGIRYTLETIGEDDFDSLVIPAGFWLTFSHNMTTPRNTGIGETYIVKAYFSEKPLISRTSAVEVYGLDAVIENTTTGESIRVKLPQLAVDETLTIDTGGHTVTDGDDVNQFQAVTKDSGRRYFLRLQPGNNTLEYTESGAAGVTIELSWHELSYA